MRDPSQEFEIKEEQSPSKNSSSLFRPPLTDETVNHQSLTYNDDPMASQKRNGSEGTGEMPIIQVGVTFPSKDYHVYDQAVSSTGGDLALQASTFRNELIQVRVAGASVTGSQ